MGKSLGNKLTNSDISSIKAQLNKLRAQQVLVQKAMSNLNALISSGGWSQIYTNLTLAKNEYMSLSNQLSQICKQISALENQLKYNANILQRLFTR